MPRLKLSAELIEYYRQEELLWNVQLLEYQNKDKRKAALNRIALKLGVTEFDLRTKINSFRTYYSKEKAKVRASVNSGTGDIYVSKWRHFEQLDAFLSQKGVRQGSDGEPDESIYVSMDDYADVVDYDHNYDDDDDNDDDEEDNTSQDSTGLIKHTAAKQVTAKNRKKVKKGERIQNHDFVLSAQETPHTTSTLTSTVATPSKDESADDDEDMHQGKLFAMWLKKIKTPRLKRRAIQQMQEVIFRIQDEDEDLRGNSQFYAARIHQQPPPPPLVNKYRRFTQYIPRTNSTS